jgi:uncharacterized protein YaeQ
VGTSSGDQRVMALKPTIYKLKITLADTDRDYYDTLNLTVALPF